MKTKILEVQNYFKAKLLAGDSNVKDVTNERVTLAIDDDFEFRIFVYPMGSSVQLFVHGFIEISLTEDEKEVIILQLLTIVMEAEKAEKLARFNELQKELGL